METIRKKLVNVLRDLTIDEARAEIDGIKNWVLFNKTNFEAAIDKIKDDEEGEEFEQEITCPRI